jgi:hypothetical protein
MSRLADASESFKSKTVLDLLRRAPNLLPNIKHVASMFQAVDKGHRWSFTSFPSVFIPNLHSRFG